jgi:hypothetical protein
MDVRLVCPLALDPDEEVRRPDIQWLKGALQMLGDPVANKAGDADAADVLGPSRSL